MLIPGRAATGPALRSGLPYGAVMATGGASSLTRTCGLGALTHPLVWLAVAQAASILVVGAYRHRAEIHLPPEHWLRIGPVREHSGALTVPLGLAVVAAGLVVQHGAVASAVGVACLVLAWMTMAVFVVRFAWSLVGAEWYRAVDGAWFLAPATLLGAGIAADACASRGTGADGLLRLCALVVALPGTAGYGIVVAAAFSRGVRVGLAGARPVLWTISAGCGGLAAAALERALLAGSASWGPELSTILRVTSVTVWALAAALAVPLLAQGALWLAGLRRLPTALPWPPTFSTAVFASGTLAAGRITGAPLIVTIGRASAYATLALWLITAVSYAGVPLRFNRV